MPQTHIGPLAKHIPVHKHPKRYLSFFTLSSSYQNIYQSVFPGRVFLTNSPYFASLCFEHIFRCRLRSEVRRGADGRNRRETDVTFFAAFVACFPALAAAAYNFRGHPQVLAGPWAYYSGRTLTRLRSKTRTSAERLSCAHISPLCAVADPAMQVSTNASTLSSYEKSLSSRLLKHSAVPTWKKLPWNV